MTYAQAQRLTRWHYQWLIVNDYLPRIVGKEVVEQPASSATGRSSSFGTFYKPEHPEQPVHARSSTRVRPTGSGTA